MKPNNLKEDISAQIRTLEAFGAVGIMIVALIFSYQNISLVSPQTETHIDVQLLQYGRDVLIALDAANDTTGISLLETCINQPNNTSLNDALKTILPTHIKYNVQLTYINKSGNETFLTLRNETNDGYFIKNGAPVVESIMVSRLISIYNPNNQSYVNITSNPAVVEVKLILWGV